LQQAQEPSNNPVVAIEPNNHLMGIGQMPTQRLPYNDLEDIDQMLNQRMANL